MRKTRKGQEVQIQNRHTEVEPSKLNRKDTHTNTQWTQVLTQNLMSKEKTRHKHRNSKLKDNKTRPNLHNRKP